MASCIYGKRVYIFDKNMRGIAVCLVTSCDDLNVFSSQEPSSSSTFPQSLVSFTEVTACQTETGELRIPLIFF